MSKEELLLEYWHELGSEAQDQLLQVAQSLQPDADHGAPDHLKVRSKAQLDQLLLQGIESLDRGEGIELTDEWWDQKRRERQVRSQVSK
ncbi:MAG: hypothetical protein HC860_14675 [Alkalinema sp. RU_4_3]|nr:hypothetical protein [Alkalinema sp. RU_4_3]